MLNFSVCEYVQDTDFFSTQCPWAYIIWVLSYLFIVLVGLIVHGSYQTTFCCIVFYCIVVYCRLV